MLEGEDVLLFGTEQEAFLFHDGFSLVFSLLEDLEVFERYRASRTEVDEHDTADDDVQQQEVQDLVDVRVRREEVRHLRVKTLLLRPRSRHESISERFEEEVKGQTVAGDEGEEDFGVVAVPLEDLCVSLAETPETDDCSFEQQEGEDEEVADEHAVQDEERVVPLQHAAARFQRGEADEDVAENDFPEESLAEQRLP